MASIVTANFDRNNVTPIRRERTEISGPSLSSLPAAVRVVRIEAAGVRAVSRGPSRRRRSPKRIFDITAASGALLFFAPLLIAIAVAIKATSPGPVLFFQYRYGYRNRRFKIYKFRTMRNDAGDVRGVRQTVQGDARVTPVGRILRKTSLDEIPQTVQRDQGRHVAGRSSAACSGNAGGGLPYEDLVPYYFQRHTARPGITGLAQVSGCRGSTAQSGPAISRIDYDLHYIEEWSLRMDIAIIIRTIRKEFLSGSGF
jgi:lipopolysaccharide/colanic/teichoic acid biosynthesis glycosyltransferase